MWRIAIEMLFNDKAKYYILVSSLTFCTFLIAFQMCGFLGVVRLTTSPIRNVNVPIWVMEKSTEQANFSKPMADVALYRIRSIPGVKWALPLFESTQQLKVPKGRYLYIKLVGVDTKTLLGIPPKMIKGNVDDLRQEKGVIIDKIGLDKLNEGLEKPLDIGDYVDINNHEAKIVGIVDDFASYESDPYVYTTYERALTFVPAITKSLSFIILEPQSGISEKKLIADIQNSTNLKAYTSDDFEWITIWWFFKNNAVPVGIGLTTFLGFIVGISISGQTFYSFIFENRGNLATLKAMGASNELLKKMIIIQTSIAGLIGYGIGMLLTVISAVFFDFFPIIPFVVNYKILIFVFFIVLLISFVSALMGMQQLKKLDPAEVFRV